MYEYYRHNQRSLKDEASPCQECVKNRQCSEGRNWWSQEWKDAVAVCEVAGGLAQNDEDWAAVHLFFL